ncbi:MAG: ATP-binding protein [Candidatus Tenebribacter davisii]|nr:ATP-binding protein [Candidatus Tenebribacter davisii]
MQKLPYKILLDLGAKIDKIAENKSETLQLRSDEFVKLTNKFREIEDIKSYKLNHEDVMIIAISWYDYLVKRHFGIDPLTELEKLYKNPATQIKKLERIISLLKKNIFFTSKKEIFIKKHEKQDDKSIIKFSVINLLENDVEFHHNFINVALGKREDISVNNKKPFTSNKEFLDDWFSYVRKIYDFSTNNFSNRRRNMRLDNMEAGEYLEVIEWKKRINSRMGVTEEIFPLIDLKDEYNLDDNELIILVHLISEELEDSKCDTDELVKLISSDVHEMYNNKKYVSEDSKLVKKGLIEISEGVFFLSSGTNVRPAPDITRRVIMRSSINDNERLEQLLKNDDIFTLVEPTQNFEDLILPEEMKKTINFSLNQYNSDVDNILSNWGLYDKGMELTKKNNKKVEPGMLMLFYGAPGTGKTFAAGAIAQALGKKLLITDISRIQSKWVGDSEKNVRRIFSLFERIVHRVSNPPVLLLNEADQFLTKRSGNANSSVDKMLNSMQNLFLEAFENLRGVLIATTNLQGNLDEAFSRRFNLKLDFPMPEAPERQTLWNLHLPDSIPGVKDIDCISLSEHYNLSGGQIKVIVKNACVEAASRRGVFQKLLQQDLIKYCELEDVSSFGRNKIIGFGG